MALVLKDRVLETCSAPGTGAVTLLGAVTGYQAFSTVGNGNTCYYAIADQSGSNWEVGIGTYATSGNTLTRTTILSSSNAGSTVNFATGTQNVFLTYPSERSVNLSSAALTSGRVTYATTDGLLTDSANMTFNGTTLTANTLNLTNALGIAYGGTGLTTLTAGYIPYGNGTSALNGNNTFQYTSNGSGYSLAVASGGTWPEFAYQSSINLGNSGYGTYTARAGQVIFGSNFYVNSGAGYSYKNTDYASLIVFTNGQIQFNIAPSGTAGTAATVTTAMTLDNSGNLLVGTTSAANGTTDVITGYRTQSAVTQLVVSNQSSNVSAATGLSLQSYGGSWYLKVPSSTTFVNPLTFSFGSTEMMRLDSSGNLGLGVTPSAWGTAYGTKVIDISSVGSFVGSSTDTIVVNNGYYSGNWFYKTTNYASNYNQSSGRHAWFTAPSGTAGDTITFTQAMTLDASGNLGIGTTSPTYRLDVTNNSTGIQARLLSSSTSGTTLVLTNTATNGRSYGIGSNFSTGTGELAFYDYTASAERMRIDSSGNVGIGGATVVYGGYTTLTINNATNGGSLNLSKAATVLSTIACDTTALHLYVPAGAGVISFDTNATERMRIDSSGNLLVGGTSATSNPTSGVTILVGGNSGVNIGHPTGTPSGYYYANFAYNGTSIGNITQSGTTAVLYNVTSDQRLKTNIVDAPSGNIDDIKVRSFDWKTDGSHQTYGMVAQELVEVAPYAVHQPQDAEEMMAVDYSKLVPMMIKEIQDLKQRIATLENK